MNRIGRLFILILAAGCELEARPMGTQLAQGRDIQAPAMLWADQRPLVLFDRSVDEQTDMHAVPFDGQGSEAVWNEVSTWSTWQSGSGYLVAEQGSGISLFTLQSASPIGSLTGAVDGLRGDELLFHQGASLSVAAFLTHLPSGKIWELGPLDQQWLSPDGRLYYLGETGIFRSLKASEAAPETADRLASQLMIAPDQTHALLRERPPSNGFVEIRDRLLLLPSLRETATLPLTYRECSDCDAWLGFSPDSRNFYYAENHRPEASVVYQVDVEALEVHSAATRPGPAATDLLWNPSGDMGLLGERPCGDDEAGCRVLYRTLLRPGPSFEALSSAVVGARFSADGKYLLFEDALFGGRLRVASTDALSPEPSASAVVLSPEGSLLDGAAFDKDTAAVVFWARPLGGKSSINLVHSADRSSLYASAAPEFAVRRLAESVDAVAVGRGHALALVRFSPQDLTGDLVLYDLRSGQVQNLASPVSAFWVSADCPTTGSPPLRLKWQGIRTRFTEIGPGCPGHSSLLLTFVVRGRVKSSKDGLWSLRVPL
jgi:hypothetical protein